jgi:hypothetical protein
MKNSFVMIGESELTEIKETLAEIKASIQVKPESEYITEKSAREIFQRQATWFWQMRKEGKLPFSKIGKTIYYSKSDIKKLFEQGKTK